MKSIYRGLFTALALAGLSIGVAATGAEAATAKKPAAPAAAASAAPSSIGTFSGWTAWTASDSTGLICYVSAEPSSSTPKGVSRDPIHFLVVDRKGLGTSNEVQTLIGYPIKKSSTPSASIDGKSYPMIADGSGAWLAAVKDEDGFVANLKHGKSLLIKGTSERGTDTTDTYLLAGVTAALDAASKACH
jgi:invasion protein IalB